MADNDRNPVQQPGSERPEPVVTDPQTIQELLIELTDLNWEKDVEKSMRPVAVMFYSPSRVFCHQMEPYFRNYAGEYKGGLSVCAAQYHDQPLDC
jgi:thioredoxin-like negative regulator of GroEL